MAPYDQDLREIELAKDVLTLAAAGGMPDTYWLADSRIHRACETLGWTHEQAREWARNEVGR